MQRILLIGKEFSGHIAFLKAQGYDYIVLKDVRDAKHPEKGLKRRILCDFSSKQSILKAVDSITKRINGVIVVYENYVLPAAWIAEHLSLPGLPPDAAEACTDKWIMRQKFAAAPEKISPEFALIRSEAQLRDFASTHTFPLIIKPANLSKSLLVTKNHSLTELLVNYRNTLGQIDAIYQKYAADRTPKLLVEEFLEGSIHSVDAFVDANGVPHILEQIVDYQTGYDIGFEDNFHYSRLLPSRLSASNQDALRHSAAIGIKALGMRSSPAHVEVIITKDGPRIVEIGARNGGYRTRMHALANGIDMTGGALRLALGQQPNIVATQSEPVGVFELFPKTPGVFIGLTNETQLRQLPSLNYLSIKVRPGDQVGKASDGFKMCAVVILHHSDVSQFRQDMEFLNTQVAIQTKPTAKA